MARISRETVDRVRDAVDMAEVVGAKVDLRRQGQRLLGLCPFHDERTPSFSVDPVEKLYICFGCQESGDVFRFVMETEGLDFPAAIESLADRYGVEIEREHEDPKAEEQRRRRERLRELLGRAAAYYHSSLKAAPEGEKARGYLAGRGLGDEVLAAFGVGFAPKPWDSLLVRAQKAGFRPEELVHAGLAIKGRRGPYDRFRGRITFPIRDVRGRVVGFGARALEEGDGAKYLNSPEGELYHKSATLYGIDQARSAIARSGRAIVVEGYTDVLALHQAGMTEAVAVMGTAITPEQIKLISPQAREVVLSMDADQAGQDAMVRAQRFAEERSIKLSVVAMPEGRDPADLIQQEGGEAFEALLSDAVELPEFRVRTVLARADLASPAGRDSALREVSPIVGSLAESVRRTELERLIGNRLNVEPAMLRRVLASAPANQPAAANGERRDPAPGPAPAAPTRLVTPRELRERALLAMCIASPATGHQFLVHRLTPEHLSSRGSVKALEWLREHAEKPLTGLPHDDPELVEAVTRAVAESEREPSNASSMEIAFLELEQFRLEDAIVAASGAGDEAEKGRLYAERARVRERIGEVEVEG